MKNKYWSLFAGLFLSLAVTVPSAAQSISDKIEHQGTSRYIKVTSLMSKVSNGFLQLQLELNNTDYDAQKAFYRVKWLDESGFQVWDDEAWKPLLIHGNQKHNVQIMSPTNKARDFRIQFNAEKNWAN